MFIFLIIFIPIVILALSLYGRYKKDLVKQELLKIPGFKVSHSIIGSLFETSMALDFENKKICFLSKSFQPAIYPLSQIKEVEIVERALYIDHSKPSFGDLDISIANGYEREIVSLDLDIKINDSQKTTYSLCFLQKKSKIGSSDYNHAYRRCQIWQDLISDYITKKDSSITFTLSTDLPVTSVSDELRKLKGLVEDGILTEQEFEQQKAKLLKL